LAAHPRLVRHGIDVDKPHHTVKRRQERLVPTEPVLVPRSVPRVEMREVSERAGITPNDVAVRGESVSCVILSPKRVLRANKLGGDWRMDHHCVDLGGGTVRARYGLGGLGRVIAVVDLGASSTTISDMSPRRAVAGTGVSG
jgi:hypothetical protein